MASLDHATLGASHEKNGSDYAAEETATSLSSSATLLSESHKLYLIERHGTLDLDPIPSTDPADPYNWPLWKVGGNGIVFRIQADRTTEINQLRPRRVSCLHGYLHRGIHYLCL